MTYWLSYCLIGLVGGGGLLAMLISVHRSRRYNRPWLENLLLMTLTVFLTGMGIEFCFKLFFAQSDTIPTLAQANWRERYYTGTMNSLGFRDKEWTADMVAGKTKVMVVGDSFVEGVGIENPADRFSNRLGDKLGANFVVFNVGQSGANTTDEIKLITEYPYKPNILIFTYFVNDIEGPAAWERGMVRPPRIEIQPYLVPLVKNSYAFNFFYWRIFRFMQAGQPDEKWDWLLNVYNNPEVWWLHQQDLLSIYQGAKSEHIPLIVVAFPAMNHITESQVVTQKVLDLYRQQGVPTLDVAPLIADIPTADLLASPVDPHPSEKVHALVADALYEMIQKLGSKK